LGGEEATLQIGERQVTLPTAEIERFWNGPFVLLWKPPAVGPVPLKPGMRGKDVLWLRQRLGEIEGTATSTSDGQVYDEELKRRVVAFQQVESLSPDGIVNEETLVRLAAATPGSDAPSLSRTRP
jgi:general secretion pathway protein A